jgi:class 3 adenylate cyclase
VVRGCWPGAEGGAEPIRLHRPPHRRGDQGEDFFGRHVNLAARRRQAKAGEVLVSSLLKELTESAGEFSFGEAAKSS